MEERKHWLLSRKFWLAALTATVLILQDTIGLELEPETIVAVIMPIIAFILGESYIDATAVKKAQEEKPE